MASGGSSGVRAERLLGVLIARSAPWAGVAGVGCVLAYLVVSGVEAGASALLGVGLVAAFFGTDLVVLRLTRNSHPAVTAAALLTEYLVKVVLLAVALWGLSVATDVDLHPTAVAVVVTTVVGVVAVTVAALRARSYVFDFPDRDPP